MDESGCNGNSATGLTLRQRSALPVIVASTSLADTARRSRVSLSTVKRWMKQPEFVYELTRLNDAALDIANHQLQALMLRAVANLAQAADNPNANIRLSAIRTTLQYGSKLSQLNSPGRRAQPLVPDTHAPDIDATHNEPSPPKNVIRRSFRRRLRPPPHDSTSPHRVLPAPPPKLDDPK